MAKLYVEEAMMSNTRAATTAAAKPLEFQSAARNRVWGSFFTAGSQRHMQPGQVDVTAITEG
jgi:hypothetical protein